MTFSKDDVAKLARLARLSLDPREADKLGSDLERIITFVEQLKEVDVDGVSPMAHAGDRTLSFRPDEAYETLGRDCLKSSAGFADGLIRVPKIIE